MANFNPGYQHAIDNPQFNHVNPLYGQPEALEEKGTAEVHAAAAGQVVLEKSSPAVQETLVPTGQAQKNENVRNTFCGLFGIKGTPQKMISAAKGFIQSAMNSIKNCLIDIIQGKNNNVSSADPIQNFEKLASANGNMTLEQAKSKLASSNEPYLVIKDSSKTEGNFIVVYYDKRDVKSLALQLDKEKGQLISEEGKHYDIGGLLNVLKSKASLVLASKKADPILSASNPQQKALDFFEKGFGLGLKYFVKSSTKEVVDVKQKLVQGPQVRSAETEQVETLIKDFLKGKPLDIKQKGNNFFVVINGEERPFVELLSKVNFNHMSFSKEEIQAFVAHLQSSEYVGGRPHIEDEKSFNSTKGPCGQLSHGEKLAINIYTTQYCSVINRVLRGDIEGIVRLEAGATKPAEKVLRDALLNAAMAVAALNKLPDYDPPKADGKQFLFRAENKYIPKEVLQDRIDKVNGGGKVGIECGFISTSAEKPSQKYFNDNTGSCLLLYNCKGKYIKALSAYPDENEVLLPPTQLQWRYHTEEDVEGRKIHFFVAKGVTVDTETPTIDMTPNLSQAEIQP